MLNANEITIKGWFFNKNFNENEKYAISCGAEFTIEKETEKAILGQWVTDYGKFTKWIPKSCIMSKAEAIEIAQAQNKAQQQRLNDYDNLVNWAKKNGVKGIRKGLKKATILAKIREAGLEYNA